VWYNQSVKDQKLKEIYRRLTDEYGGFTIWMAKEGLQLLCGLVLSMDGHPIESQILAERFRKESWLNPALWRQWDLQSKHQIVSEVLTPEAWARLCRVGKWLQGYDDSLTLARVAGRLCLEEQLRSLGLDQSTVNRILLHVFEIPVFISSDDETELFRRIGLLDDVCEKADIEKLYVKSLPKTVKMCSEYESLAYQHRHKICTEEPFCLSCCLADLCGYVQTLDRPCQ